MLQQLAFLFAPRLTDLHFCSCVFLRRPLYRPLAEHERDPPGCGRVVDLSHEVRGRATPHHAIIRHPGRI